MWLGFGENRQGARLMALGSQPTVADVRENTYEEGGSMDRVKGECLWVVDASCYGGSWLLTNDKV